MKTFLKKLLTLCLTAIILLNGTYFPDTSNDISPQSEILNTEKH